MSRVLVTGGAGFIGSHLSEALLRDGRAVIAIDNFEPNYPRSFKEMNLREVERVALRRQASFQFIEANLNLPGSLESIRGPVDTVFHLAARPGVRPSLHDPAGYIDANITGTVRMLEWARQREIPNFVFGSSSSVYGNSTQVPFVETENADQPLSPYAATKRAGELFCSTYSQLYGTKTAALRFFTVYGRRQRPDLAIRQFAEKLLRDEKITLYGNGSTARDYTHVSDIVRGILSAEQFLFRSPRTTREIFNLGGSHAHTLREMLATIEAAVDAAPARIDHQPMTMGDVEQTWADLTKSRALLDFNPRISFAAGVADMVVWLRETGNFREKSSALSASI